MFHMEHKPLYILAVMALSVSLFAAKPKTIKTTGTVVKVISCYGPPSQLAEACKRDGAIHSDFVRLHVSYIHVPSLHATYETVPHYGWGNPFASHYVPVVGRKYRLKLRGGLLYWFIGQIDPTDPSGPQIHPKWQPNAIKGVSVDPQ